MILQCPELYDGGYWYVVNEYTDESVRSAPDIDFNASWTASKDESTYYVRCLEPVDVEDLGASVSEKHRGRVGGD